jgi:hypothetical protein
MIGKFISLKRDQKEEAMPITKRNSPTFYTWLSGGSVLYGNQDFTWPAQNQGSIREDRMKLGSQDAAS